MSEDDRISELEREVAQLRHDLTAVGLYHLQQINLLRSLIENSSLNENIVLGNRSVKPFEELGEIFDRIVETVSPAQP